MYRSRKGVQRRAGFREYDRAIPVPEIFQVRCLETDELFDVGACDRHTATERQSSDPRRAAETLLASKRTYKISLRVSMRYQRQFPAGLAANAKNKTSLMN